MKEPTAQYTTEMNLEGLYRLEDNARKTLEQCANRTEGLKESDQRSLSLSFGAAFQAALDSLPREVPFRHWVLDDFYFEEFTATKREYALRGRAHWLQGGSECPFVELNVERGELFRYSYKLNDKRNKQNLYVGKLISKWTVSCTGKLHSMLYPLS